MYGLSCEIKCGYCYNEESCDKVNGVCVNGCVFGWIGNICNKSILFNSKSIGDKCM